MISVKKFLQWTDKINYTKYMTIIILVTVNLPGHQAKSSACKQSGHGN